MLNRNSLALRVYGFAIVAFVLVAGLLNWTFATIRAQDQAERHDRLVQRTTFLARELARAGPGTPAAAKRLIELEDGTGFDLTYVPWDAPYDFPDNLRHQAYTETPSNHANAFGWVRWARIEVHGTPIGALRMEYQRPFRVLRTLMRIGPPLVLATLALLIIPPLILWVVRPIRKLEAAAHRLGDGDLETPIRLHRQDELGRLAQAFDEMRDRLRHMLHARDRLLTDVSHELRGPLARMAVAQELLEADIGPNPYVARLRREMRHLDQLTGELLSLSRQRQSQAPQWEDVSLADLIQRLVKDRDLIAQQHRQTVTVAIAEAVIRTDPELLARAVGNVLDNALKYGGPGATVTIASRQTAEGLVLTLHDTGPGIPAADLPHIFEPFYRPDLGRSRSSGGTGLGLAIVRAIVDRLQGTVTIDSQVGVGTTLTLTLPVPA